MALKVKYKDEHGVVQIDMSPTNLSPQHSKTEDLTNPQFDTINNRFGQYDLFGGKYDDSGEPPSLFRSRYNSIEEELANTPYAFATERSLRLNSAKNLDITIQSRLDDISPSNDIEDDKYFNRNSNYDGLFGPEIDYDPKLKDSFTVTQLIHAQDRYFDLSSRQSTVFDSPGSSVVKSLRDSFEVRGASERTGKGKRDEAFTVLPSEVKKQEAAKKAATAVTTSKRKRELSFAILTETPSTSRPTSPRSLPVDIRHERVSPFRGRGFREETSRHNTPRTSAANSRASSPPRRRTNSLSRIDKMAQTATLPPPVHLNRPNSPRNFLKENIQEIRGLSEINREKHEAEAEKRRLEEEEALLKEMGLLDKNAKLEPVKSVGGSRTNSRSNSPSKINLRSRSNSPSAILHFENISMNNKEFVNSEDGMGKPVAHKSRVRSLSRSQPQSNDGSPKHSKIPKRQSSVSPNRTGAKRDISMSRRPVENNLNRNQRFISNSTSSIHETIKIGSNVHDKRAMSQSSQHLNLSPSVKGKPPISPGRGGPPPANKTINSKRLSPIVGTPNKSPIEDLKPVSARIPTKPSPATKKLVKTAGNTPASSRLNSRQPSRTVSRDPSPDKRKILVTKPGPTKPVSRVPSTKTTQKPTVPSKIEPKKPINRTSSMKSLNRTPSTKNLSEKPPMLKKRDSKKDLTEKAQSTSKINEVGEKKEPIKSEKKPQKDTDKKTSIIEKKDENEKVLKNTDSATEMDEVTKQDNETQYDKLTNEKGELVILTKKNVVSMTTAAITSQPLEVVTTVTNQLPAAFEKAREKGIFERLGSKDSLAPKDEMKDKENTKPDKKESVEDKEKLEEKKPPKPARSNQEKTVFTEDHIKLKPLQPPYNNPQVERAKQKIDDILKEPEVSRENILTPSAKSREVKNTFKNIADKTKTDVKEAKDGVANKLNTLKDQVVKQNERITAEIRSEATKIVESIITPVEEPKDIPEKIHDVKKDIEPIVMVVNEKKTNGAMESEKINETLVKGDAEVEVQSSNVSTPGASTLQVEPKMADGNGSDRSAHSNGGFPQSTSTTPKPPARAKRDSKDKSPSNEPIHPQEAEEPAKKPNICSRLMGKCKNKCTCCVKGEHDPDDDDHKQKEDNKERNNDDALEKTGKTGMSKWNCCKKKEKEVEQKIEDIERAAGKATIEFENETKRKRKLRDIFCGCCGSRRRVSDVSDVVPSNVAEVMPSNAELPGVVTTGCCGKKQVGVERRDSILSDRPPTRTLLSHSCCNNRLCTWVRGMCRRHSEHSSSRRTSLFSKNKSLSPTLPPEDTRKKLDTTLVEHTSVMRGAIPVLPIALAYFCLFCNVLVPGLGTILSGMFCLCFGIPRFGVHDGAKHRIGSLVINLVVGCGQLFTVLFCLVGWGWSIWWGVIMLKVARKYRKLKAEAAAAEAEAAPPVTANNHTRA